MMICRYDPRDLALMPPRPEEAEAAEREHEMAALRASGPAYTLWGGRYDTEPIAAAGVIIFQPGVGEAWLRGSTRMDTYPRACARYTRKALELIIAEHRLHRVQITVKESNRKAVAFALWLGFEIEGVLRQLGSDRSDYLMLSQVTDGRAFVRRERSEPRIRSAAEESAVKDRPGGRG